MAVFASVTWKRAAFWLFVVASFLAAGILGAILNVLLLRFVVWVYWRIRAAVTHNEGVATK